ncbi:hypothetical protein B723_16710 [Pseudomonas fluorescens NCIMB 11764]|uniref:Uncharacterized protein n=1 Tax=Pseudomonas fluorescens NCIMB 11764 TaxID=1221522 RepID=A0A0K1QQM8_PSEFL|nr:hypothetical protein B723_16710 [Pseudomonas fluorescens NCIMB 11764]
MKLWYRLNSCTDKSCAGNTESWFEMVLLFPAVTVFLCWPEYMQALFGLNNDKTRYTAARKLMVQ